MLDEDPQKPQPSEDAKRIATERLQKLNVVMNHLGFREQPSSPTTTTTTTGGGIGLPDQSSLLSSKDIAGLRASVLNKPPDSYILAGLRWMFRSLRHSVA